MNRRFPVVIVAVGALLLGAAPAIAAGLDTKITSGPSGLLASRTAKFRFKSNDPGAAFRCRLDAGPWTRCTSPKRYTSLAQGPHTFRVTAIKPGALDRTPAVRNFTVDTVKPETTIYVGPSGETSNPLPTFRFFSNEAGTFQCKLGSAAYQKCSSPYAPAAPLTDGPYEFKVRARDKAGNVDPTPASRSFTVERVLTVDLAGAQAAAEHYFPEALVMDVQPMCSTDINNTTIECPDGTPKPPSDQLAITSSRAVVAETPSVYDVTVTSGVSTLLPVQVSYGSTQCAFGLTSSHGEVPSWTVSLQLFFEVDPGSGEPRVTYSGLDVTGVETPDWAVSFWGQIVYPCFSVPVFSSDYVAEVYGEILDAHLGQIGSSLCAVPGPDYLGECP